MTTSSRTGSYAIACSCLALGRVGGSRSVQSVPSHAHVSSLCTPSSTPPNKISSWLPASNATAARPGRPGESLVVCSCQAGLAPVDAIADGDTPGAWTASDAPSVIEHNTASTLVRDMEAPLDQRIGCVA